jgi:hypothetical protein
MSQPTSAPGDVAALLELIQHFRQVLTEWDRFLDWVEAERREMQDVRAQSSALAQEHTRLRSAHDALREDFDRIQEELRSLRLLHESLLREQRDTYEILDGALRRLKG